MLVVGDDSLQILSEVRIECNRGVALLRLPEDFRDRPPASVRRTDDRHGTMILLDDHLDAFLDLGQHGMDVACEFGFRDADRSHRFDHSVYSSSLSSTRLQRSGRRAARRHPRCPAQPKTACRCQRRHAVTTIHYLIHKEGGVEFARRAAGRLRCHRHP